MVFCPECGTENDENSNFCKKCGSEFNPQIKKSKDERIAELESKVEKIEKSKEAEKGISNTWYIVGVLMPLFGFLGGMVFMAQGKKGGVQLFLVSCLAFIVWFFIFSAL